MDAQEDINDLWHSHLQYVVLTRNCHLVSGTLTPPVTVDYLNIVLPPLAFLRTVSLLDESLQHYLDANGQSLSRPYRNDLNGRITYLNDQRLIANADALHRLRQRRNAVAHRAADVFTDETPLIWSEIDVAIDCVESTLQQLGLVGERPAYEFHYGRDVNLYPDDPPPEKPDVRLTHHYYYGIKDGDDWVIQFTKSLDYHRVSAGEDAG